MWNGSRVVKSAPSYIWERRKNLRGFQFRRAFIRHFEQVAVEVAKTRRSESLPSYMLAQHLDIEDALNASSQIVYPGDGKLGSLEADGKTWNGMVIFCLTTKKCTMFSL